MSRSDHEYGHEHPSPDGFGPEQQQGAQGVPQRAVEDWYNHQPNQEWTPSPFEQGADPALNQGWTQGPARAQQPEAGLHDWNDRQTFTAQPPAHPTPDEDTTRRGPANSAAEQETQFQANPFEDYPVPNNPLTSVVFPPEIDAPAGRAYAPEGHSGPSLSESEQPTRQVPRQPTPGTQPPAPQGGGQQAPGLSNWNQQSAARPPAQGPAPMPQSYGSASMPQSYGSASMPQSYGSASMPQSYGSAAHPESLPSAGYPQSYGSAPYPQSQGSAPYPQSYGSAPYPQSYGSAPYPQSYGSAPYPQSQGSASYPQSYGSAQLPPSENTDAYAGPQFQPSAVRLNPPVESTQPTKKKLSLKVVATILICVMGIGGVVLAVLGQTRQAAGPNQVSAARQIVDPAPPGWSRAMNWSRTLSSPPLVAVGLNRVAVLDSTGKLDVLNADTGASIFSANTGASLNSAKPFISTAQGTKVVGVVNGPQISLWPLDGSPNGDPKQLTIPASARLYQQGGGLMVVNSATKENWAVTSAFTLAPVTLPQDHVALGVTADGFLVSAPERGSWTFNPTNPGAQSRQVTPESKPDDSSGDMMVAWASRGVVLAWSTTSDANTRTVGLYEAETGKLKAQAKLPTGVVNNIQLTVSPTGELAAAGPMLAKLSDGQVRVTERWSTIMSDTKNLYGTVDGQKMIWNGTGDPVAMEPKAVVPWGVSDQGLAIVMNQTPNGVLLGGLRPA